MSLDNLVKHHLERGDSSDESQPVPSSTEDESKKKTWAAGAAAAATSMWDTGAHYWDKLKKHADKSAGHDACSQLAGDYKEPYMKAMPESFTYALQPKGSEPPPGCKNKIPPCIVERGGDEWCSADAKPEELSSGTARGPGSDDDDVAGMGDDVADMGDDTMSHLSPPSAAATGGARSRRKRGKGRKTKRKSKGRKKRRRTYRFSPKIRRVLTRN